MNESLPQDRRASDTTSNQSLERSSDIGFLHRRVDLLQNYVGQLKSLIEVTLYITSTLDLDKVLQRVLEVNTVVIKAEASALLMLDESNRNELEFVVALGKHSETLKGLRIKMGQGIAGTVAQEGKPLIINDTSTETRFFAGIDSTTGFRTRSILAVPLKIRDEVIGVMEFLNKLPLEDTFHEEDMEICTAMSNMVSVAVENARSYRAAITDRLTELYNFSHFKDRFAAEVRKAQGLKQPLSVVMIDVDHFKYFNDTHGHDMGNQTLKQVAQLLKQSSRDTDIAARYGGEEFVVVLPETRRADAWMVAERMRRAVWDSNIEGGDTQPLGRVSISAGVSTYPEDGETDDQVLHCADQNLYQAKAAGRNLVMGLTEAVP